jgi:branched-chain amino acid transport system substrate-binding protein
MLRSPFVIAAAALLALASHQTASAQERALRLGFMSSMSGPIGALGGEQRRGLDLALSDLGGKIGGLSVEIFTADDQAEASAAVQGASKLLDKDKVDIITGLIASQALIGASKTVAQSGKLLISANAGPSQFAGKECNPNFFFTAWQNDQADEAVGRYLNEKGFKRVYFMGFDNQAGYDHINGAKRTYKGENLGEAYTGLSQVDFSSEFARVRAAKPDALFVFYVGAPGVAFVKQYSQTGLKKDIPVFSFALADAMSLKAQGAAALGVKVAGPYFPFIDNPQNKKFVAGFRAKYGRDPSFYAANQYDAIMLMDAAIRAVGGKLDNQDALRAALRKADFKSLRGTFKFNVNNFPIQDYYIAEVAKRDDGEMEFAKIDLATKDGKDSFYEQCKMPTQ